VRYLSLLLKEKYFSAKKHYFSHSHRCREKQGHEIERARLQREREEGRERKREEKMPGEREMEESSNYNLAYLHGSLKLERMLS
jgi:hypothetical protein